MNQKTVKLNPDQHQQLKAIQERDGVPIAVSVRKAVNMYLRHWGKLVEVEQREGEKSAWDFMSELVDRHGEDGAVLLLAQKVAEHQKGEGEKSQQ